MTDIRDGGSTEDTTAPVRHLSTARHRRDTHSDATSGLDPFDASRERHPSTLGRDLDDYLAAVADELNARGVLTGTPQRSDRRRDTGGPVEHQLSGSIVLDTTALQLDAWTPTTLSVTTESLGGALHPPRPAPIIATWDEDTGWSVHMNHDPTHASPRYLHPDLLPTPTTVADFIVGLALGELFGANHPITAPPPPPAPGPGRPHLHLVPGSPHRP